MKSFIVMAFALSSFAAHAGTVGTASLTIYPDFGSVGEIDTNDIGTGLTTSQGGTTLGKTESGYQGFYLGERYWDISCDSSGCQGNGPTQLSLTLTHVDGGYTLDGQVDFYPVTLTVTATKIQLSVADNNNTGFELDRQADGSYSGDGATSRGMNIQDISLTYSATGTMTNAAQDPATAFMLLAAPFVQ